MAWGPGACCLAEGYTRSVALHSQCQTYGHPTRLLLRLYHPENSMVVVQEAENSHPNTG